MHILYSSETVQQEKRHARIGIRFAAAVGCAALLCCIALCIGVRTANAPGRRLAAIAVSTLAGWAVILLFRGLILPEKRESLHEEGILQGIWDAAAKRYYPEPAETHTGELLSVGEAFRIPRSISFCPVELRTEAGETVSLRLNARALRQFPPPGTVIHVRAIRKYITEYEVGSHG